MLGAVVVLFCDIGLSALQFVSFHTVDCQLIPGALNVNLWFILLEWLRTLRCLCCRVVPRSCYTAMLVYWDVLRPAGLASWPCSDLCRGPGLAL